MFNKGSIQVLVKGREKEVAKGSNAAYKALYDRLVGKGKNGQVALIAVCHKLLKQAFAIVKSSIPYRPDFATFSA